MMVWAMIGVGVGVGVAAFCDVEEEVVVEMEDGLLGKGGFR